MIAGPFRSRTTTAKPQKSERLKAGPKQSLYSPGKVGFYPPLIAKETRPTALRALVYI